jgi:pimeloyl-ACP methyl ester carboxylesterase
VNIRPFRISIPPSEILNLKRRLEQTRWSPEILQAGWNLGMDSRFLRSFVGYWLNEFDWNTVEAALNAVPQFEAVCEAGSIHFVHLKTAQKNALPIVLTHGWPSTFAEFLKLGEMLANPANDGGPTAPAFNVVIPSLPGFAFSSAPTILGTNSLTIAAQWAELMQALGYPRFIAHGGDLGAGVSTALGLRHSDRLLGIHLNFIPGSFQPHIAHREGLTAEEVDFMARRAAWLEQEGGYSHVQATKPDVLGPALNDSPVGLAAWILDKFRCWSDCEGNLGRRFTQDELLTNISLYWFTRSMPAAIRIYWEGRQRPLTFSAEERVNVPVAVAHFRREIPIPPRSYVERGYNVVRWTEFERGGHFAALEEPEVLAQDIRAFATTLRPVPDPSNVPNREGDKREDRVHRA